MYIISVQSTCTCMCKIAQCIFLPFSNIFSFSLSISHRVVRREQKEREREGEREKMRFYIYILLFLHLLSHVTSFFLSFSFFFFLHCFYLCVSVCMCVSVCIIVYVNKRLLLKAAPQIEIVIPGSKKEKQFVLSIRTRLSQILFAHCFDLILTRLCPRIKMEQCLIIIKLRNGLAI